MINQKSLDKFIEMSPLYTDFLIEGAKAALKFEVTAGEKLTQREKSLRKKFVQIATEQRFFVGTRNDVADLNDIIEYVKKRKSA